MRFFLIGITLLITFPLLGQDIIVRITGDTLHVKVESTNDSFVYYKSVDTKNGSVDVISKKEIAEILYKFEDPSAELRRLSNKELRTYELMQFWVAFSGYYLPNSGISDNDFKEYYQKLEWGTGLNAGVNYYFNQQLGIGMMYSKARFKNSVPVSIRNSTISGNLSDDLTLHYLGASVVVRFALGSSNSNFFLGAGPGINYYFNDAEVVYAYNLKANGIGFHVDTAVNLNLGGGLYMPIKLTYMGNTVGDFTLKPQADMPDDIKRELELSLQSSDSFSVTRFSLSAGLLFAF
ncbi:hypothetical protein G3O08_18970 [Cryomorpha ignava]|uniref:Outer membrane beta-barrel protein n=1 Tax=Cryomorpha ignava TaxID=101383 RepID=A0A7K3WV66_9FLAO|nr:hypothetical protein [Cryomorpha ignava]NEN25579.1 hypothetical protein [Cryomorpha ignava]